MGDGCSLLSWWPDALTCHCGAVPGIAHQGLPPHAPHPHRVKAFGWFFLDFVQSVISGFYTLWFLIGCLDALLPEKSCLDMFSEGLVGGIRFTDH